jgi:hypothetical protein
MGVHSGARKTNMAHSYTTQPILLHTIPQQRAETQALKRELHEATGSGVSETNVILSALDMIFDDPKLRGKLYHRMYAEIRSGRKE